MSANKDFSADKYANLLKLAGIYSSIVEPSLLDKKFTQRTMNDLLTGKVDDFDEHLEKLKKEVKNIKIYATKNTCGIVTFTIANIHSHDIISILNLENISVRAGHHCAMPLHRYIDEVSTLRLSFGMYTTKEEIDYTISKIIEIGEMFNWN